MTAFTQTSMLVVVTASFFVCVTAADVSWKRALLSLKYDQNIAERFRPEILSNRLSFQNLPARGKMAKLFCAIVGVLESVLSVQIDENKSVGDLQKAIKSKDPITIQCKVDLLQLFLAKKNGMWLKETELKNGVSDTSGLKPLNLAGAPLNSVNLSEKDVQLQVTVDDFKVGKEPVHVLVMILKHNKLQFPVDVLLDAMLSYMALDMPTTETVPNIDFKDELCEFYGCFSRRKSWVRCMLLDVSFPDSLVIASHLFRRSNEYLAFMMMKIPEIDDVRNGLLLFKPLKHAFDRCQISFILDDTDVFRLKLFDPNIRNTRPGVRISGILVSINDPDPGPKLVSLILILVS